MAMLLGRRRGLEADARSALAAALDDPIFELLPLKNLPEQIPHLPAGARVSVTASPAKGIDATLDWAPELCTAAGILHGGVLMSLADAAGGVCAFLNLPPGATGTIRRIGFVG